jgi:arsenate reductase
VYSKIIYQRNLLPGKERMMNIQIFGTKKCQDSRKAERYFKERGIRFQFVNLAEKGLSKGELASVKAAVGLEALLDTEGKQYRQRNLKYLVHDVEQELLNDPLLLKTPIVRNGPQATVGYRPEVWKEWE